MFPLLRRFLSLGVSVTVSEAVFIDNVTEGSTKKRQQELGVNAPRTGWVIASELRDLTEDLPPGTAVRCALLFWYVSVLRANEHLKSRLIC